MRAKNIKRAAIILVCVLIVAGVLNLQVSIRQNIDGKTRRITMPLYVKWIEFLSRHYEYDRIAKEVASSRRTDAEKALAIFKWTGDSIKKVPQGMPVVDDHIYNIIVRGYGTDSQSQDVFTTLCSYAHVPAFWERVYYNDRKSMFIMSFVKLNGKWAIFDSYNGTYFMTADGKIATIDDMSGKDFGDSSYRGVPFSELKQELERILNEKRTTRPEKQMPARRIWFEIKKVLGIEKEDEKESGEV
ncbi:MAG: hypothetical protein WC592_01315 [Candidatus Omnitrophota bacterium]|nr:hypothetical protein [Candidatus Omnitrophota bacterium]